MGNRRAFLILLAVLALAIGLAVSVSAQDVNVDSMSNEDLLQLLQTIMQKMETSEESAAETVDSEESNEPAEAMIPAADPEGTGEAMQFTIYENKKLTVEALPGYMFIQPTKESKPEKDNTPEHYENEPGIDEIDGGPCHWTLWEGKWYCMKG